MALNLALAGVIVIVAAPLAWGATRSSGSQVVTAWEPFAAEGALPPS